MARREPGATQRDDNRGEEELTNVRHFDFLECPSIDRSIRGVSLYAERLKGFRGRG